MSQQCPGSQEGNLCPGRYQEQQHQLGKGGDCPALLCTHLKWYVQFWQCEEDVPQNCKEWAQCKEDIKLLESVQRGTMKVLKGLEGML